MKKVLFVIAVSFLLQSCLSYGSAPLKSNYANDGIEFKASGNVFENVKKVVIDLGMIIKNEDQTNGKIIAVLSKTSWTWETKGKLDNPKATAVIKRFKNIGANKIARPISVITTWSIIVFPDNKVSVKAIDVTANYKVPQSVTDINAGYSIGNMESKIEQSMK